MAMCNFQKPQTKLFIIPSGENRSRLSNNKKLLEVALIYLYFACTVKILHENKTSLKN